jgi:predicted nucleic acid-binding protein
MSRVFADSYYFFALLNRNEPQHERAVAFAREFQGQIVLTTWILLELGDGLCRGRAREAFLGQYEYLRTHERVHIVPCSDALMQEGLGLYRQRMDKDWSLTDCTSFIVMQREGIREALTGDQHFEQAGFVALLK